MKKILFIWTFIVLTLFVQGQYPGVVASQGTAAGGSSYHAITQAALDAMTREPAADTAAMFDTFIRSMVDGGYWTGRVDLCYITCQGTNTNGEAYINWANPGTFNLTDPGATAPTFTPWQGFTGDGSSDYLLANYIPGTDAVNISQNSVTLAIYCRTAINASVYAVGVETALVMMKMRPRVGGLLSVNLNAEGACSVTNASSQGFLVGTRRGATEVENYAGGASLGADTDASNGTIATNSLAILANNNDGTIEGFAAVQLSLILVMDAVSDAESTAINTIVETLMDDLGIGVQ